MTETAAMTTGQYLQARRIKAHQPGATVRYIAVSIGATEAQVRAAIGHKARTDSAKPPRAKKLITRLRPGLKVTGYSPCGHRKAAGIQEPPRMVVPQDVLADRDRRMAFAPNPFGDPAPGYSALDKRQG